MRALTSRTSRLALLVIGISALVCGAAVAQGTAPVPTKLFGIELGTVLDIDQERSIDPAQIPVKTFRGMKRALGYGIHYYFEPIAVNPTLPYKEDKKKPADEFYETSFRLYLLPIAPIGAKTPEDFERSIAKYEILTINWEEVDVKRNGYSPESKEEKEARFGDYLWAMNLCKTFQVEFAVKPKVSDFSDTNSYICEFTQGERTFEVSSFYRKSLRLSLRRDLADKKNDDFGTAVRQLQARDLLK
jgi:hypothetical protein